MWRNENIVQFKRRGGGGKRGVTCGMDREQCSVPNDDLRGRGM
jgi:hypothetical protein